MSKPTPHHPAQPTTRSNKTHPATMTRPAPQEDQVAGDPPIPITVWRTARIPADTSRPIGARLAARIVTAYSRPGDEVIDLTPGHTLAAACLAGQRPHLPAWFTEASSLIIGPATQANVPVPRPQAPRGRTRNRAEELDAPELSTWFGDDLTDPDLPGGQPTTADTPPAKEGPRMTGLVVVCWPLHEQEAANRVRLAWLLTVCGRLLRPGGCLILAVTVPPATITTPEDFSPIVQAAAGVGFGYLQHIVAVHATTTHNNTDYDSDDGGGDAFVYHVTDEELLTLNATTGRGWAVAHLRVHADLLVFSRSQTDIRDAAGARTGKRGGRRA